MWNIWFRIAFLMDHGWLGTERAASLVILTVLIKFCTTTKAVLKTVLREQEWEAKTKERKRSLLGTNAFTLKTQKQRVLADKKLFGCCSRAVQKSPFKEWNKHIPFLAQNKNCSRPSLLLWNILLTRPIKTTIAKYTRESPFPTLPVKEAVNQQAMVSTLSSRGEDVSPVDTSKHLLKGRGN